METADEKMAPEESERMMYMFKMNSEAARLASFKDWPFSEDCSCVPSKMAEAGFYHCPTEKEPDVVRCFVCSKELDGWEPSDDPWKEHKKHSSACPFLSSKKDNKSPLTFADFMKEERTRCKALLMKRVETKIKEFLEQAALTRSEMEHLAGKN